MRIYSKDDYDEICDWCLVRDIIAPPAWSLPETGIMIDGVAVGFLIVTNNCCGILDMYISNPMSEKRDRDKALDDITVKLIDLAKKLGIKSLQCNSQHPAVKDRAAKHGFNLLGNYACFSKGI